MDAAGVVESVGPGVSRLHPGQKVIAAVNPVRPEGGAQAQHIVVPAASVVPIPEGVSLAQASILLMTGLTALNALEIAALKKGQILAVTGGAGLLAQYAIAAAKRQGIKVIADANPADAELVCIEEKPSPLDLSTPTMSDVIPKPRQVSPFDRIHSHPFGNSLMPALLACCAFCSCHS